MKKWCVILVLLLAGCAPEKAVDLQKDWDLLQPMLPEMLLLSQQQQQVLCGIHPADCKKTEVYLCADSLRADEVWLVEATDEGALERLEQAARHRLQQKKSETVLYSPQQYAVVQGAKILIRGNTLVLLVSPEAARMEKALLD